MLKVGVFGAGQLAKIHIQHWKEIPGVTLIGFYEPDNVNAEQKAEEYGLKRYSDADELMNAAEVIDLCTASQDHVRIAEKSILNQKHVFIEQPLARSLDEAAELVKLVNEANIKCQVGHAERYNPAFCALNGKVLQPMFIEAHRLAQFSPAATNISVIMDMMIHDIDIVLHLVKSPARRISASGVAIINETADIVSARIEFDNGCVANLTASRVSMKSMQKMRLFQRDAYIGINFLDKKTEIISLKDPGDAIGNSDFALEMANGDRKIVSVDAPNIKMQDAVRQQLEGFTDAILNDKPVQVSVYDGYQAMDVAEQVLKKMSLHNEMHNV